MIDAVVRKRTLYAGLVLIGFCNGISEKVFSGVVQDGLLYSVLNTFNVSVIVWGACLAVILMLYRGGLDRPVERLDLAVAAMAALLFLVPVPSLSWLALAMLACWLVATSARGSTSRRAGAILFALTIPMLWSRLLFAVLSGPILHLDALLAGWVVGTPVVDNLVPFADGSGFMFFGPGCSSISNLSLAVLCVVAFANLYERKWSGRVVLWGGAACAAVILINVLRTALIGFYPDHYDLIHGPEGNAVAGWLTAAAILGISFHGIGGDATVDS